MGILPCLLNARKSQKRRNIKINGNKKTEYFTRFPNKYIQGNIKKEFGVSRKFYITYILIDKYRSYEDYSWITIRKVLDFYGYKTKKNKPKAVYEILDVLEYMINNKMIEVKQDLDSLSYDTGIEIKIISTPISKREYVIIPIIPIGHTFTFTAKQPTYHSIGKI